MRLSERIKKGMCKRGRRLLRQALTLVLGLDLTLIAGPARAIKIRTGNELQFQTLNGTHADTAVLRAGSIVEIPDEYRITGSDGRADAELTLNNWLKNAGRMGSAQPGAEGGVFMRASGRVDYFYPVKIVEAADGSRLPTYRGGVYFLALRILQKNPGEPMRTIEDAPNPAQAAPVAQTTTPHQPQTEAMAIPCIDGRCKGRDPTPSPAFQQLMRDLSPALNRANHVAGSHRRRTSQDFEKIESAFHRTCGFPLSSFVPVIRQRSEAAGIPSNIMLAIMVQESSGHCFDVGHNRGSSDRGLFGLNSLSTRVRACTWNEKQWLRSHGVAGLANGPRCIENPLINLDAAIQNLRKKLQTVTQDYSAFHVHTSGFDASRLKDQNGRYTADAWRLAVSAYNGGERWVMNAKSDLEHFNHTQGTHLDPHNWEDLRIFYLRRFLGTSRELRYFDQVRAGRTSTAYLNLAYTENVVPRRSSRPGDTRPIAELWRGYQ